MYNLLKFSADKEILIMTINYIIKIFPSYEICLCLFNLFFLLFVFMVHQLIYKLYNP